MTRAVFCFLLALLPLAATAQTFIAVDAASVFEGNSGTKVLKLPVHFVKIDPNGGPPIPDVNSTTVTGFASATVFSAATGGATCGAGGVDFEQFTNVFFSIPPSTPNGTLSVNVKLCGDTTIETDERIFVSLTGVSGGATCGELCATTGSIINDDGPPGISINDIGVSHIAGIGTTANFTVSLHHPSTGGSIDFTTRDGTAKARTTTTLGSYVGTSGTKAIPAGASSVTIPVSILPSGAGTFSMVISNSTNGPIIDSTGNATIKLVTLTVGTFDLSPDDARTETGKAVSYSVGWTVSEGEVWRNLRTLDLRFRKGHRTALWVRWDEVANSFSVCRDVLGPDDGAESDEDVHDKRPAADVVCSPGETPGSLVTLGTRSARLNVAESSVIGSGPTGQRVTLDLPITFESGAAGHYRVELAATDDLGHQDEFVEASELQVVGAGDRDGARKDAKESHT